MPAEVRVDLATAKLQRALGGSNGMVTRYVIRLTREIRNRAVLYCPVDTGNLRASIVTAVSSPLAGAGLIIEGTVGTPVEYAVVVHEGRKAGVEQVAAHTVRSHRIKAHTVAARTQLSYTVPAKGGRAGYTVRAHTIKKHRVATRTQLSHTVPAHTRTVSAREGRPFLRRAMNEVVDVNA